MTEYIDSGTVIADMPDAKAVSLHDIYRVIAGNSYYHGDRILAALTCIVEGKEVNPVLPADVAPVVHGVWIPVHESEISGWNPEVAGIDPIGGYICSACKNEAVYDCNDKFVLSDYCLWCGAKMYITEQDDV